MNKTEFIENLLNDLRTLGYEFDQVEIIKQNDTKLKGYVVKSKGALRQTFYLENYYNDYLNGDTVQDISSRIILGIERTKMDKDEVINIFSSFEDVKEFLRVGLVSTELNDNFLKDKPFMKMGDVTVVFYVCFREDEDGNIPISWITNKLKDSWSINLCDLYSTAIRNSMREDKAVLTSIQDAMFKMTVGAPYQCMNLLSDDVPLDPEDMYVLTNKSKNRGAAVILYEGVLSDVADRMCVDVLYIIPSSIHEVIVLGGLKCSEERVCTELEEMIRSINETEVLHEEILGNRPLIYRRKDDRICSMSEI